jgi:hypothetical protein
MLSAYQVREIETDMFQVKELSAATSVTETNFSYTTMGVIRLGTMKTENVRDKKADLMFEIFYIIHMSACDNCLKLIHKITFLYRHLLVGEGMSLVWSSLLFR